MPRIAISRVQSTKTRKRSLIAMRGITKVLNFNKFLTCKNIFLILTLFALHYLLSDGTVVDYLKQLTGWLIIPLISSFIKPNR